MPSTAVDAPLPDILLRAGPFGLGIAAKDVGAHGPGESMEIAWDTGRALYAMLGRFLASEQGGLTFKEVRVDGGKIEVVLLLKDTEIALPFSPGAFMKLQSGIAAFP